MQNTKFTNGFRDPAIFHLRRDDIWWRGLIGTTIEPGDAYRRHHCLADRSSVFQIKNQNGMAHQKIT